MTLPDSYSRIFGQDTATAWDPRPEHNHVFLKTMQHFYTDMLRAKKFVQLSSVYESLGLSMTPEALILGWVLGAGDNFVDFGMHPMPKINENGDITLEFNLDGVVYDLVKKHEVL